MGKINSRRKGAQGERDWANWLKDHLDPAARRGANQGFGGAGRPDVESSIPVHWEVKNVELFNVYKAMDQAYKDVRFGNIPAVAHKRNRTPWHVTILANDLLSFCEAIVEARRRFEESAPDE